MPAMQARLRCKRVNKPTGGRDSQKWASSKKLLISSNLAKINHPKQEMWPCNNKGDGKRHSSHRIENTVALTKERIVSKHSKVRGRQRCQWEHNRFQCLHVGLVEVITDILAVRWKVLQ